ncbi:MAG TPA: hypothetical protein PLQ11_02905 [Beijerinckiaceae bacterium]|nr:hypothetical protein [Beijerinckiaceae bacterium]
MKTVWNPCRAIALAGLLALGGCGGIGGFGETSPSSGPSLGSLALFGNPQNLPPERQPELEIEYTCPSVSVIEGAAAYRAGRGTASSDVSHQASLSDVARECRFAGTQFTLKVGVQGRMLIGAQGKAGSFTVPVKVLVKRGDTVVATRAGRVSVSVPAGEGSVAFTHVEDNIVLPITAGRDPSDEYDVYVGFEAGGAPTASRDRRRR